MDQPWSGRFQPKEGADFPQAADLGGWSRSPFQSTEHETLILIHARDQLEESCVCFSPSEAGKNASLVGPGSWLLGYVTATPPRAQRRVSSWQGTSEISQPGLSVYGTDAGRSWLPKVTEPWRGGVGTVEKVSTREPDRQAPGPGLQFPGMRLREMSDLANALSRQPNQEG